jgi:pimeloyl-ACP methyl ester carboxylesterase
MLKTLTHRHATVAYEDAGQGSVVVLLHGFAEDSTVWKHQVGWLSDHYRIIVPDFPGSGLSPHWAPDSSPEGPDRWNPSVEDFAELIKAILTHENIRHCCLIGHSMGGYVTLAFAEAYPELLSGWGLFHSTAFADSPEKQQARQKGIAFIQENGTAPFLKQSMPNLFAKRFKETHPDQVASLIQRGSLFNPATLIQYYKAMLRRPDRRAVLSSSMVPVWLMIGEQDPAVPLKESLEQTALAQTSFVHILEDVAHMGMWEAVTEVRETLSAYLTYIFKDR